MGGASRYVFELAQALKNSHNVVVAAGGAGELFRQCENAGIRTIPIPNLKRDIAILNECRVFFFLLSLFRKEKPDIVHLNSPKAGGLGALAAHLAGVSQIIYTAHGWTFFEDRPFYQRALIKLFSYATVLLATTTIAVSKKDAGVFAHWLLARRKVVYIPNGVRGGTHGSRDAMREKLKAYGVPLTHPFVFGTIAELHKNKGLSYLIEAIRGVQDAMLIIIGEGEERRRLTLAIGAYKLRHRVVLAGHISDAAELIPAFDAFVLPSVKEGLPYVMLEAGIRGVPTVATNVGGIPDVIEDEKTGLLVPPKDPSALAAALKRLINDEHLRYRLGTALKQKVERDFSLDLMLEKTVLIYK